MIPTVANSADAPAAVEPVNDDHGYQAIKTILNSLDALVYVSDMDTYELLYINDYGKAACGDGIGRKCYQVLQTGQQSPCQFCTNAKLINADNTPGQVYVWEFQNTVNNRWYQCRDQAIYWVDGRLVRLEIATDITERKEMEQQLAVAKLQAEWLANTDELTRLYNRRAFFALSQQLFYQVHRAGQKLAVVMFDLDRFKSINDRFGHATGDAVLVKIAGIAKQLIRGSDLLARVGGEEFAIVLPDTDKLQASSLVERLRDGFEQGTKDDEVPCTASFGVTVADLAQLAVALEPQSLLGTLLHEADLAMMQAKVSGRNRACIYQAAAT